MGEALILSENRKLIQDEVKQRKEERERLIQEVKLMKQKMIESEQEERRKVFEKEREKMKKDHERKEELKQQRDKEKVLNKIKAIKDEEEREKEILDEHYKTKMTKKIVERADEDEELILDEDEDEEDEVIEEKEPESEINPFYSSYKEALAANEEIDDPLKEEREKLRLKQEEDEKELKKLEEEVQLKKLRESPEQPSKKSKAEFEIYSGVGIVKALIDNEKDKIQKELAEGEAKSAFETALEEEKRKKTAEKVLKK